MSRATNDMSAVRMVLGPGIMYTASTVATFVGAVAVMLVISPRLTLLALLPLVLVSWLVRHYGRKVHDRAEEVQAQLAELNALVQENLAGARVVRAYTQEAAEQARFAAANHEYVDAQPAARAHHRHPAPRDRLPDGPRRRDRRLARRPHGDRGHASRSASSSRSPST